MSSTAHDADQHGPPACQTVADVLAFVPLDNASRKLAGNVGSIQELLGQLHARELDVDAMRVMAYVLPVRLSVWWSLLCAWHGLDGSPHGEQNMALQAATRWALKPTEAQRRIAEAISLARPLQEAADCCVRAASVAGRIEKSGGPFIAKDVATAARMVLAAVFLAYSERAGRDSAVSYRRLAQLGLLVNEGKLPIE